MRIFICIFIILTSSLTSLAQINFPSSKSSHSSSVKTPPPKAYRYTDWSVGFALKSSYETIMPKLNFGKSKPLYQPKFSYEAEIFVEKRIENNWRWASGINFHGISFEYDEQLPIYFSKNNGINADEKFLKEYEMEVDNSFENIKFRAIVAYQMFDDENDYQDGDSLNFRIRSVNKIQYLGFPISIKKEFSYQKLRLTARGGIEPAVLLQSKIDYDYYHQSGFSVLGSRPNFQTSKSEFARVKLQDLEIQQQRSNLKKIQWNAFFALGLVHSFKYHTFFMEGEIKRGFLVFSEKQTRANYFQSIGFRAGFIKRFKAERLNDMKIPERVFNW